MTRDTILILAILLPIITSILILLVIRLQIKKKPLFLILEDIVRSKDWSLSYCEYFEGKILALVANSPNLIFIDEEGKSRTQLIDIRKLESCLLIENGKNVELKLTTSAGSQVSIPFKEKKSSTSLRNSMSKRAVSWYNRINATIQPCEEYEMGISE